MNITLWITASVLAAVFLAAGAMKLSQPTEKLASAGMAWAEDTPGGAVRTIGALEVLGALGLILPAAFDVAPVLVGCAAVGLVVIMLGAAVLHSRRREAQAIPANLVLLVLAAVVAWGRFGPYAF
ncbi:DoxX family protein [Streptomyces sp. NPDC060035]|uniref:DoxX family protein n=1 Tax=Streptomyces sp. NPDC060035 TaxID=3347044 RepID=UPI00369B289A